MAVNIRVVVALAAVLGAAILSNSVGAQALPEDALLVEHWNGWAWSVTPAPGPAGGSELSAVTAISATNVWAVGSFVKTTGTTLTWHPLAEHYDGVSWSPVVLPTPNQKAQSGLVAVSGSSATDVWAVGSIGSRSLIEHYDGKAWKVVSSLGAAGSELAGVAAISRRDAWAVGATGTRSLIEHWNGSAWRRVPIPAHGSADELLSIAAWSARNIWAVGDYRFRGHSRILALHWNGSRWKNVWSPSSPSWQSGLRGVTVMNAGHVWAVGSSRKAGAYRSLAANWDYCHWNQSVSSASDDVLDLNAVGGVPATHEAWAVGSSGGTPQPLAERWIGSEWKVRPTPDLGTPAVLRGVAAVSAKDVWAVGSSTAP